MTKSAAEVDLLKRAPEVKGVFPEALHRWSPRSFSDREVSTQDLRTIFEAVRWTASSFNEQPWRYLVGRRGDATYNKIFESLVEFNQVWAKTAPVLIMNAARKTFSHNGTENVVAIYDLGASAATLCYQAMHLGIHTHQMGGYSRETARKLFNIPDNYLTGAVIAMGYLGEPSALTSDSLLQQEISPRERKPVSEFVYSAWGEPARLD